jgi:plasmid stabilization system protein ParE
MKYRISSRANRDIEEICDRIAQDKPSAADRFDERLHQTMQMLAKFPGAGHTRTDVVGHRYLFWSVGNYVIAYRVERAELIVVRVVHGARNFRKLFAGK